MKPVFWEKDSYILRSPNREDAMGYYCRNFCPLHPETARLTGSKLCFSQEEVVSFFYTCLENPDRYDFLLLNPDGEIIGESVLNEQDRQMGSANFRIVLFHPSDWNKGLGSWMVERTLAFAFTQADLRRVELGVYSMNPRAIRVYEKAGFQHREVIPQALELPEGFADEYIMDITRTQWDNRYKGE